MSNYKIPMRMCVACHQMFPKKDMTRVTRSKEGEIMLDKSGKLDGRGAYICKNKECVNKCKKSKLFNRSFKSNVSDLVYSGLDNEH